MANTINKNVIVPDVYAQLVREKIAGKCKVAQFLVHLGDLHGKVGETLTMPKWAYIGDAKDWDISKPMDVTQMKQTSTTATIKAIQAPAVKVADYDDEVELGNAIDEAASQQAAGVARKYDTDAIACALESPLKYKLATKNTVTQDDLIAILGLYGDDRDSCSSFPLSPAPVLPVAALPEISIAGSQDSSGCFRPLSSLKPVKKLPAATARHNRISRKLPFLNNRFKSSN